MKPLDYVDQRKIPYFKPALKDEVKLRGSSWFKALPTLVDPAGKFV